MGKRIWISILICLLIVIAAVFVLLEKWGRESPSENEGQAVVEDRQDMILQKDNLIPADDVIQARCEASDVRPGAIAESDDSIGSGVMIESVVQVPPSLTAVMGDTPGNSYLARIDAVHGLGTKLSGEEIQTLYALLDRKNDEDALRAEELNAIKNDVVNLLKEQRILPDNLERNLVAMYHNREHDDVWRDYCLQHLGDIYGRSAEKKQIAATLWDGAKEDQLSIAGTALIALANNIDGNYIKKEDVAEKALALAVDPKCGELSKITALQICAKLGEKRALETARSISQSKCSVPLRISAIAAVGTLGDASDREMIEKYAQSSDVRLRKSAESALERLNE